MQTGNGESQHNYQGKISIMLADDHPLLRKAVKDVLEQEKDFEVIAEADDGEEAVKLAEELVPDVIIMDITMPKMNGLEATREIHSKLPQIIILVLTVHTDSEHILGILEAGAVGYLTKKVFGQDIIHAVRAVMSGESVLSQDVSQRILRHALAYMPKPSNLDMGVKLTVRDKELLQLMALGRSNKEIASRLGLSLRTVKNYLADIFSKLGVSSRTEAVIYALRHGFISLEGPEQNNQDNKASL